MRKWLIRISLSLAALVLLLIVIVQLVLWSPLPKRIVIQTIEKELGLRISADSLTTGWLGKSELTNVSLGLPLSDGDFLKVKSLKIKHSSLIGLALGTVTVDSVEVDDPVVQVIQNPQGQWNLQQVIVLLGRLGGGNSSARNAPSSQSSSSADKGVPKLPIIKLVNGTVHVTDNQKRQLNLAPLNINGDPSGALVWNYTLSIADSIKLDGKLAPGGNWQHQLTLNIHNLNPLLKGWGISNTYDADVTANWYGQLSSGGKVNGLLVMNSVTAKGVPTLGDVSVTGSIHAENDGPAVTLHPQMLDVKTSYAALPEIGIRSGSIVSDNTGLHADAVKVAALGGLANLSAAYNLGSGAADLNMDWSGLSLAKKTNQNGSLNASLRLPFANQPTIKVELTSAGTYGDTTGDSLSVPSNWQAKFNLTGQGTSWQAIDWVLTAPQLTYSTGPKQYNLSNLSAHVSQRLPTVELTDLSLPPNSGITGGQTSATFTSSGKFDNTSKKWNFDASGGFNTEFEHTPVPVTIALHTRGNSERYDLTSLTLGFSDITVAVDGSYDTKNPTPVGLTVALSQQKRILPDAPVQGEIAGQFKIVGDLFKEGPHFQPYLTTTGDLRSSDLVLFGRPIGDVDITLNGLTKTPQSDPKDPNTGRIITTVKTTQFYLFQAPWTLSVDDLDPDGVPKLVLETHRLSLDELAKFAKIKGVSGQIDSAKWTAKIPSLNLEDMDLQSEYHLEKPAIGGLSADSLDMNVILHDGVLKLDPLLAKNGAGTITTSASFDLKHPRHLLADTTINHWPYELSSAVTAQLSGRLAHLDVDLKSKDIGASGTLTANADLLLKTGVKTAAIAHSNLTADIRDRTVDLKTDGNLLTGTYEGSFQVDLSKPLLATGLLYWKDLDLAAFSTFVPAMDGARGRVSGAITLAPARDPRPLEPVRVDINVASTDAWFRSVQIGGGGLLTMHAVGYLNTDRAILDHSDIYLAGGQAHLWARADNRGGRGLSTQTLLDFEHLQLDQLAHIDPKIDRPMPGLLNGQITGIRSGSDNNHLLVQGHVNLNQTDLVNFGPIAALYNVMNAGGGISNRPNGYGSVDLSFEQNILHINGFRFFNRGIDAKGLADIGPINYDDILATPIGGQVVGTARALKGSRVKVLSDFDQYVSALQSNLTSINVTGPLGGMIYTQAGLADIGTAMRQLLIGDARNGQ
jgi:hypothetical protein